MPGFIFNSALRPYQAPVDLGTLERTYNKLEEGHQQTIGLATAYKTQLASLDLNAEEDVWRQQKIAQIDNAIANNITYGNAYTAMDDVMKEIGDIASDPGMIGRIRAQKQYTDWLTKLDNSNLSQDYKNYFKEKNKYYYEDKFDNNGKVIGGTEWLPQENWVDQINYAAVMQQAIQLAAEEQGGGTSHYFIDANGNRTNDMSKATSAMYIDSVTGQWTKLSEDKIKLAFDGLINANPEYSAAVDQDYKIAKDYYEKEGTDKYGIIGLDGYEMTRQQFLDNKIDPIATAASYYRSRSSSTIKEGIGASLAASGLLSGASSYGGATNYDPSIYTSNKVSYKNEAPVTFTAQRSQSMNGFKSLFPNFDFTNFDYAAANTLINESNLNNEQKFMAQKYLNEYLEAQTYLNSIKKNLSPEQQEQMDTKLAIDAGAAVDPNTESGKKWTNFVNNIFGDGNKIGITYNTDDINEFIEQYPGGENALNQQGIIIERNGDTSDIVINSNNKNNFYQFMKVRDQIQPFISIGTILNPFNSNDEIWRDSRDNKIYYNSSGDIGSSTALSSVAFRNGKAIYDSLESNYDNSIASAGVATTSLEFALGPNPRASYYRELFHTTGESKYKQLADYEEESARQALQGAGLSQYDIWGYAGDGDDFEESLGKDNKDTFGKLNSEDRYGLQQKINSDDYDLDKVTFSNGIFNGQPMTQVIVPGRRGTNTTEAKAPIKFYIRNFGNNKFTNDYMNQAELRAINTVADYTNTGVDIPITNVNPIFDGLRRFSITPAGDHKNYTLNNLTVGKQANKPLTKVEAERLKAAIYKIEDCISVIATLGSMPEVTQKEFNDAIDDYCAVTNSVKGNVTAIILENVNKLLTR